MTSSMNHDADPRQTIVEDIDAYLEDGMPVFDENTEKVGDVKMYSAAAGYLMVGTGVFNEQDLYIPFRLILSIGPHDIFLAASKETLAEQYTQPPQARTIVETRLVAGRGGSMSPQTREVQVLPSGYDGGLVEVNAVPLSSVTDRLAVGMVVYDATGKRLGDITEYDTSRSLMVVEKGIFKPRAVFVPFSAITDIDMGMFTVYLSIPEDALLKEHSMFPSNG